MKSEDKFYYIGEVSEIVGVPSHIIRYWEKEFPQLTIEELMLLYSFFTWALIKAICEVKKENVERGGDHDSACGV